MVVKGELNMNVTQVSRAVLAMLKILKIVITILMGFEVSGLIWYLVSANSTLLNLESILGSGTRVVLPASVDLLSSREGTVAFFLALLGQASVLAIVYVVSSIFQLIQKNHTPFVEGIASRMKIVALLVLLGNVSLYPGSLLSTPEVSGLFSLTGVLGTLVISGALYCFALIFDYGCQLQQESDETL